MRRHRVGLIGTGLMGHGIGKNLLAKGYSLTVSAHLNRAPVEDLITHGANEVQTPAAMAQACDVILLCVTGSPQVEEIVYGENGLLDELRSGLIIADCSTARPSSTIRIAADVQARGAWFVDTPMTRTPREAEAGELGLIVGGLDEVVENIMPVLKCFADTIIRAGEVGAAHRLKLINNFLSIGNAAIAAEAITTSQKAGVDIRALRDIVMAGGAASVMFDRLIHLPISGDDSYAMFSIRNARKDLRYFTNMTEELPMASFMAETVHQLLVLADNMGYGESYIPRLIDALSAANGIDMAAQS